VPLAARSAGRSVCARSIAARASRIARAELAPQERLADRWRGGCSSDESRWNAPRGQEKDAMHVDVEIDTDAKSPWTATWDRLAEWDPEGAKRLERVRTHPWQRGVVGQRELELISLTLSCACTSLDEAEMRRHIHAAIDRGAARDELLVLLRMGVGLAVHSCSLGAPIVLEEAMTAEVESTRRGQPPTPACDAMRAMGNWNAAWDPFLELAPEWTERFFAFGASVYKSGVFAPKFVELLGIAFDASVMHMYAPGTRRHIRKALELGVAPEEIMAVLEIRVSTGVQACVKAVPIMAEELERK
jgi:alkylhydroperoxidase/carboxymuconolactone decarboxylase family protein YurZ